MSKSVMISIQPKWCELIANGKKTIEVRKTKPKIDEPFKCYIYCTKSKKYFSVGGGLYYSFDDLYKNIKGKIKYGDSLELMACDPDSYSADNFFNGKVFGEFVCDEIIDVDCDSVAPFDRKTMDYIDEQTCLNRADLWAYTNGKICYGWQISELKIYDKPKALSEFGLSRPPQSWGYVEEMKNE